MDTNEKIENLKIKNEEKTLRMTHHYHGDKVRIIYLIMAVVMLVTTPFFKDRLPVPALYSIFGVIVFAILAGLTNPKSRSVIFFDFFSSIGALLVFGNELIKSYDKTSMDSFFWWNLVLALLSLLAIYFSSKTFRGHMQSS